MIRPRWLGTSGWIAVILFSMATALPSLAAETSLRAGAAKVDITNEEAGPVNDRLYARALVLNRGEDFAVIVSVDAVAIGEIGPIGDDFLPTVRAFVEESLSIDPRHVFVNASHCHGIVAADVAERTIRAIREAYGALEPVTCGVGTGHEDRIMGNRRLKLNNGREVDVRRAYALPPDDEVAGVGPIDPEIGVLRLDRADGRPMAVVYNFACHPIQGVPSGGNTADLTGFASKAIEDNLGEGAIALFIQGCAGDINPVLYKNPNQPPNAEDLGNKLALSTLATVHKIRTEADDRLHVINERIALPRADLAQRIVAMEAEQQRQLQSLRGTSLNLKSFIPLLLKYRLSPDFPSFPAHEYLHQKGLGHEGLKQLDAANRANLRQYIRNIQTMEELTRLETNLALLRKHHEKFIASRSRTIEVEVGGLRIADFVLITFPGELTVEIGLGIKKRSPHANTLVAGYTNGYIYYAPTAEQLRNVGGAQEDSDCLLAPEWQAVFEAKVQEILEWL